MKKKHKKSSTIWLQRRQGDGYIKKTRELGFRSRAAFKLIEINDKYRLFSSNIKCVLDLGAAPGSWLQVVSNNVAKTVLMIGVDRQSITPFSNDNVVLLMGDFTETNTQSSIVDVMRSWNIERSDVILSDMAENSCGDGYTDHIRIADLIQSVMQFSVTHLNQKGHLVMKLLHGIHEQKIKKELQKMFRHVDFFKPSASYKDSSEIYIVCIGKL